MRTAHRQPQALARPVALLVVAVVAIGCSGCSLVPRASGNPFDLDPLDVEYGKSLAPVEEELSPTHVLRDGTVLRKVPPEETRGPAIDYTLHQVWEKGGLVWKVFQGVNTLFR